MQKKILFSVSGILLIGGLVFVCVFFLKSQKNSLTNHSVQELAIQNEEIKNTESQNSAKQGIEDIRGPQDAPEMIQISKNSLEVNEKAVSEAKISEIKTTQKTKTAENVTQKLVSFGFQEADSRSIKAIIIHTSYNALGGDPFDFSKVMQEWKEANVSPHYAIDRSGKIYQLVVDNNIAWHAGSSKLPDGTTDVNGFSIGIEVVNSKDFEFTDAQYSALNRLLANLKNKYQIKYILGHDDIAPGRKTDPWNIDWKKIQK